MASRVDGFGRLSYFVIASLNVSRIGFSSASGSVSSSFKDLALSLIHFVLLLIAAGLQRWTSVAILQEDLDSDILNKLT